MVEQVGQVDHKRINVGLFEVGFYLADYGGAGGAGRPQAN